MTLARLLAISRSNWSLWLIEAVLVCAVGLSTRAVRISVWAVDGSMGPMSHTPLEAV